MKLTKKKAIEICIELWTWLAETGLEKIRRYLKNNPPANVHNRAMKMLASLYVDGIMTKAQREKVIDNLFAIQKSDGGWNLALMCDEKNAASFTRILFAMESDDEATMEDMADALGEIVNVAAGVMRVARQKAGQ